MRGTEGRISEETWAGWGVMHPSMCSLHDGTWENAAGYRECCDGKAESAPAVGPGLRVKGQQGHAHSTHFPNSACFHSPRSHSGSSGKGILLRSGRSGKVARSLCLPPAPHEENCGSQLEAALAGPLGRGSPSAEGARLFLGKAATPVSPG